jgi:hypothetical protein
VDPRARVAGGEAVNDLPRLILPPTPTTFTPFPVMSVEERALVERLLSAEIAAARYEETLRWAAWAARRYLQGVGIATMIEKVLE